MIGLGFAGSSIGISGGGNISESFRKSIWANRLFGSSSCTCSLSSMMIMASSIWPAAGSNEDPSSFWLTVEFSVATEFNLAFKDSISFFWSRFSLPIRRYCFQQGFMYRSNNTVLKRSTGGLRTPDFKYKSRSALISSISFFWSRFSVFKSEISSSFTRIFSATRSSRLFKSWMRESLVRVLKLMLHCFQTNQNSLWA